MRRLLLSLVRSTVIKRWCCVRCVTFYFIYFFMLDYFVYLLIYSFNLYMIRCSSKAKTDEREKNMSVNFCSLKEDPECQSTHDQEHFVVCHFNSRSVKFLFCCWILISFVGAAFLRAVPHLFHPTHHQREKYVAWHLQKASHNFLFYFFLRRLIYIFICYNLYMHLCINFLLLFLMQSITLFGYIGTWLMLQACLCLCLHFLTLASFHSPLKREVEAMIS